MNFNPIGLDMGRLYPYRKWGWLPTELRNDGYGTAFLTANAAVAAMDHDMSEYFAAYKKKRDMIYEGLADKFELARPAGAYYAFVKAPAWAGSATEFVERVIENNVLVIPGNVFSEKDTHFRISYAATDEKIAEGIEILRGLAAG